MQCLQCRALDLAGALHCRAQSKFVHSGVTAELVENGRVQLVVETLRQVSASSGSAAETSSDRAACCAAPPAGARLVPEPKGLHGEYIFPILYFFQLQALLL